MTAVRRAVIRFVTDATSRHRSRNRLADALDDRGAGRNGRGQGAQEHALRHQRPVNRCRGRQPLRGTCFDHRRRDVTEDVSGLAICRASTADVVTVAVSVRMNTFSAASVPDVVTVAVSDLVVCLTTDAVPVTFAVTRLAVCLTSDAEAVTVAVTAFRITFWASNDPDTVTVAVIGLAICRTSVADNVAVAVTALAAPFTTDPVTVTVVAVTSLPTCLVIDADAATVAVKFCGVVAPPAVCWTGSNFAAVRGRGLAVGTP
jgi:hypothetical protein